MLLLLVVACCLCCCYCLLLLLLLVVAATACCCCYCLLLLLVATACCCLLFVVACCCLLLLIVDVSCCCCFPFLPPRAIGYYASKLARDGLISFSFSGSWPMVAPFGSKTPLFGTNPVAIGIPTDSVCICVKVYHTPCTPPTRSRQLTLTNLQTHTLGFHIPHTHTYIYIYIYVYIYIVTLHHISCIHYRDE